MSTEKAKNAVKEGKLASIIGRTNDEVLQARAESTAKNMKAKSLMVLSSMKQQLVDLEGRIEAHKDIARIDAHSLLPINVSQSAGDDWFIKLAQMEDERRLLKESYASYVQTYEDMFGTYTDSVD
jgi:hypothetical protein